MPVQVTKLSCPTCGGSVNLDSKECEYCGNALMISSFQSVASMPVPEINKHLASYRQALTEEPADKAAAMKITLTSGRVDYVIYATNPNCLYSIVDNGKEVFTFQGFAGVCSYESGVLTYAWGNEVTSITDSKLGSVIEDALPNVTGTVVDFTKELLASNTDYTMTVTLDQSVSPEQLKDKWIYVNNDGTENAVYRIYDIDISGLTVFVRRIIRYVNFVLFLFD